MARVTVEDCLQRVANRFTLVHLAARRVRQLRAGSPVLSDRDNKDVVLALREIASGKVNAENLDDLEPRLVEAIEVREEDSDLED